MSHILRRLLGVLLTGLLGAMLPCAATATVVTQTLIPAGGNTWSAEFNVANDGSLPAIESFTIYLDFGLATNLVMTDSPAAWDSIVVQPDDALGAAGYFDALLTDALGAISPGAEASGFSVQFAWAGPGAPGLFSFTVNDSLTFDVLEAGRTTAADADPSLIPEPPSVALAALALMMAGASRIRSRGCSASHESRVRRATQRHADGVH